METKQKNLLRDAQAYQQPGGTLRQSDDFTHTTGKNSEGCKQSQPLSIGLAGYWSAMPDVTDYSSERHFLSHSFVSYSLAYRNEGQVSRHTSTLLSVAVLLGVARLRNPSTAS